MQQMPADGQQEQWEQSYRGHDPEMSHAPSSSGQKLDVDEDEQFATVLVRKMKAELKDEWLLEHRTILRYRLALAIVSISVLVPLFIALVVALALGLGNGAGAGLAWALIAICILIGSINASFNQYTKSSDEKKKAKK